MRLMYMCIARTDKIPTEEAYKELDKHEALMAEHEKELSKEKDD
jgi:hypothetical protein